MRKGECFKAEEGEGRMFGGEKNIDKEKGSEYGLEKEVLRGSSIREEGKEKGEKREVKKFM